MFRLARRARPAKADRHLRRLATRHVERPDGEVALEDDRSAIIRHRRPQYAPCREARDGARLSAERLRPDVLGPRAIRDVVDRLPVAPPHRPLVALATADDLLV